MSPITTTSTSSSSSSSSSSSNSRTSVFTNGYISTSKNENYRDDVDSGDSRQKGYLKLSDAAVSSMQSSGSISSSEAASLEADDFWEFIITDFVESHAEKYAQVNTLSESFAWFATGPKPVSVSITCYFLMSKTNDYRTKFLFMYAAGLRARQLTTNEKTLKMVIKDTSFNLIITGLQVLETSDMPDYATCTITGIAYKYKNTNSTEELYTKYYGTATDIVTNKENKEEEDKKKEEESKSSSTSTTSTTSTTATTTTTTTTSTSDLKVGTGTVAA